MTPETPRIVAELLIQVAALEERVAALEALLHRMGHVLDRLAVEPVKGPLS